uniref:S4 domain-containing protein n=1 Tax=Undibacterium sp. TaxID=1914977 RepID=UPI0037508BEE
MNETVRLAKRLAEQVPCSRQEAEQYIAGGWVKVDGVVLEEAGYRIAPEQKIELIPTATLAPATPVTFLINKPAGIQAHAIPSLLKQESQMAGDRSNIAFLKRHLNELTLCGDLKHEASGLVV